MTKKIVFSLAGLTIATCNKNYKEALFVPSTIQIQAPLAGVTVMSFTLMKNTALTKTEKLITPLSLHAPSLLVLWAISAKQENPTLIKNVFSNEPLSRFSMYIFKYQLLFERFRLGSDAESLIARNILRQNGIDKFMPNITIEQWLTWLNKSLKVSILPLQLAL